MDMQICNCDEECIFKTKEEATGDVWYECLLCKKGYEYCQNWLKYGGDGGYQFSLSDIAKRLGTMLWIDDPENEGKFLTKKDIDEAFDKCFEIWNRLEKEEDK